MKKPKFFSKIHKPKKKTVIALAIIILLVVAAIIGYKIFKGDANVEYKLLTEAEIPQQLTQDIIPEYKQLERALACVYGDKIYVLVTRGEKPTGGYDIAIDHMKLVEKDGVKKMIVYTIFKDPQPGVILTQALTYPYQVALTELGMLPDEIELKVNYED